MLQRPAGRRFLEVFLFSLSSLVLYHMIVGIPFFLIPLQVVASRRGLRSFLAACGMFMVIFLLLGSLPFLGGSVPPDSLGILEIGDVLLLLLGLAAVNLPAARTSRALFWLMGSSAAAGLIAFAGVSVLAQSAAFQRSVQDLANGISRWLTSLSASGAGADDPSMTSFLSPENLRRMAEAYLPRTILPSYFMILSFSWWAGQVSLSRAPRRDARAPFHFAGFRLEALWLWPLIASWALILADLVFHVGAWTFVGWNVGLTLAFLYGLQGLAILRFLFEKHGLPRILWLLLVAVVLGLAARPRAGAFVLIALPAFGVSENWIRYRVPRGPAPDEQ